MTLKYSFFDDYSEGAHPKLLEALLRTNFEQHTGYGLDDFSREAGDTIKKKIGNNEATVHFVSGGTQANLIALASMMKSYESVVAASSAHINVHEAGVVEFTGHKINTIHSTDGKITRAQIEGVVLAHTDEHMVKPRVVFISQATEVGTVYSKRELDDIAQCCKKYGLYFYIDGARIGTALVAANADVTLEDIARYADAFYIGGTKNGALLGEAVILVNPELQKEFRFVLKQHGALLAKGRIIGIQFNELFKDNLFFELARHANAMAEKLVKGLKAMDVAFLTDSPTNQIFPIFPQTVIDKLKKDYGFYVWSKVDGDTAAIRLVTSWATEDRMIEEFLADIKRISI